MLVLLRIFLVSALFYLLPDLILIIKYIPPIVITITTTIIAFSTVNVQFRHTIAVNTNY